MKVKHLLLGLAVVAIMTACSKKAETTSPTTEATPTTQVEVTPEPQVNEPVQETAEATTSAKKQTTKQTAKPAAITNEKKEEPKATDPCEAAVKAYEKYADQLKEASKNKATPEGLTAFVRLKKQASAERAKVNNCTSNPEYKTRLANAVRVVSNLTM